MKIINELKRQRRIHNLSEKISKNDLACLRQEMPVQKIIGFINFDKLVIKVNHKVFIPRYETEEVVNYALKYISSDSKVLDLGCGSGYIGLTIKQKTNARVTLVDIDDNAVRQTQENAAHNHLDVQVVKSDLFANVTEKFDVIISNPPYVPTSTKLPNSVFKHEPLVALYGGRSGNDFYRKILAVIKTYLKSGGYVIFEIAPHNKAFLDQQNFTILNDINKKARIAIKKIIY